MFDTYGPFEVSPEDSHLDRFLDEVDDANDRLREAIGVYVVAAGSSDKESLPWYVGRTWNGFERRIRQHTKASRFHNLFDQFGSIQVFLIPRTRPTGRVVRATAHVRKNGLESIRKLEFALIGACYKLNPDLLNTQIKGFHKRLYVPGFLDEGKGQREKGAKAFGKLLKT